MLRRKKKAVFLDRDGTLVRQVELPRALSQLKLFADVPAALARLHRLGYFLVMITNQPVVARGIISLREAEALHRAFRRLIKQRGGALDAVYFCPHHPHATLRQYRKKCRCRKPEPGMIVRAAREHRIDLSRSFLIGDSTQDMLAGNRAKIKTILVSTGYGGKDPWRYPGKPDFKERNLLAAVKRIERISQ